MSDKALVPTTTALDRLKRTAQRDSLDDFVTARTRQSVLLVDVSGSMDEFVKSGEGRKIDQLRRVVDQLLTTHPVPIVAFGIGRGSVELVERIPEPSGMTPLDAGIDFCRGQEANHIVLVTDGMPDSRESALNAAKRFNNPIDVFYIGEPDQPGARFCAELAKLTGGQCGVTDLTGEPKKLAGKIRLLLGDGNGVL